MAKYTIFRQNLISDYWDAFEKEFPNDGEAMKYVIQMSNETYRFTFSRNS
jgi:hypothetical protein